MKLNTKFFAMTSLKLKKHSPEILISVGIAGMVAGTVVACKSTTKASEIINQKNKDIETFNTLLEDDTIEYTKEDVKKDMYITYVQTAVKLAKVYAPAACIITASALCIISGNSILRKRTAAIAAAYASIDAGFRQYRKNVVAKYGDDVDYELKNSIISTEITKNGKKETVLSASLDENGKLTGISDYARFFDETCSDYEKDAEYNLMFLRRQQDYANEMLKSRGHLFLNEVYDLLDIPRSKAGQVVGWVYDDLNTNGDNYIDFGIYDGNSQQKRLFVNGLERAILLDFNVDGVIYDII